MDSRTSRRILAATRDGRSTEVIDLARKALAEDANDVEALYHLAQGLDSAGEPGEALPYAERAITVLPTCEGLLLAARCASKAGHHDQAYAHAQAALANYSEETHQLPAWGRAFLWIVSWVPGFRRARTIHSTLPAMQERSVSWLKEYIDWYERQGNAT